MDHTKSSTDSSVKTRESTTGSARSLAGGTAKKEGEKEAGSTTSKGINCKRCRRKIRSREAVCDCRQHRGIVCEDCSVYCDNDGHDLKEGRISRFGEFIV